MSDEEQQNFLKDDSNFLKDDSDFKGTGKGEIFWE